MRSRLLFLIALLPVAGCRAPSIPAQPKPKEYAVYNAWLEQASTLAPRDLLFAVDSTTLAMNQNQMQFQQCLPTRMETAFDGAPIATLTSSSGNDWLNFSDGRHTTLYPHDSGIHIDQPIEFIRLSRVAFTRSGSEAFLWTEQELCHPAPQAPGENPERGAACEGAAGVLLHGRKSDGSWTFEETTCRSITFPQGPKA